MAGFGDPVTQAAFSMHENKGVFALMLGSGVSRAAEIPTGWEITIDLVRRVAEAEGIEEQTDWVKWYVETEGKDVTSSELNEALDYVKNNVEKGNMLATGFKKALSELNPDMRKKAVGNYMDMIRDWAGM